MHIWYENKSCDVLVSLGPQTRASASSSVLCNLKEDSRPVLQDS